MEFKEYATPHEGNFIKEGRRLLGDQISIYSRLQEALMDYPAYFSREQHLSNIQKMYSLATSSGLKELVNKTDPLVPWMADEINTAIEGKQVVDLGCCDGFFTTFYALNHPSPHFLGIDIAEGALRVAKLRANKYHLRNIKWIQGDLLDPSMEEFFDADTIILQDVLYQVFGSRDVQKEEKMLRLLGTYQHQGSIVVIGQEGNRIGSFQETSIGGYVLEDYRKNTVFDKNCGAHVTCEVAIFRR